jgi:4-amino-4-deoxy-L-arabinose transferase-like glycosyltransferase
MDSELRHSGAVLESAEDRRRWLLRAYIFIGFFLVSRLAYLAAGRIELSEDEAYQWLWSKHLDWSYYSKPPLIAVLQFISTSVFGDTEFGIRFFSPALAAVLSMVLLRFLAAEVSARAAFWLVLILAVTPMLAVGSTLLTIDAPSAFFWAVAMIAGWRAVQTGKVSAWCWTGLFTGLGLLSKYTAIVQILAWGVFFILWRPARAHLRRAGPYLALSIALVAFAPVIWWNSQHDWVTLAHLHDRGGLTEPWRFQPRFFSEFLLSEFGLLNPVFFVGMIWAGVRIWPRAKTQSLLLFLFAMGAPLFLFYFFYTVRARVQPNWIAPAIVPLFAIMVIYFHDRWSSAEARRAIRGFLALGLGLGFVAVGLLHATELLGYVAGRPIPAKVDPLHRVRGWTRIAAMFGAEREKLFREGNPVFFITQHYGLTSILTFYLPEAKRAVGAEPLVYHVRMSNPENQFYFWPGYENRKGQSAIFIQEINEPTAPPAALTNDFASVTDMGMRDAFYNGQVYRRYQLYLCRGLKGGAKE